MIDHGICGIRSCHKRVSGDGSDSFGTLAKDQQDSTKGAEIGCDILLGDWIRF